MLKRSEFLKNKKIRILLCVQFLFVMVGVLGLFGPRGIVIGREQTQQLLTEGVSLAPGVYTARLYYESGEEDPGSFGVTAQATSFKGLLSNEIPLYKGIGMRECQFYLREHVSHLRVNVQDNGAQGFQVLGAEIQTGTEGSRIYLFWVLLSCALLDSILMLAMYHKRHPIPLEKQLAMLGIPALTVLSSIPVMVDYNIIGADLAYHLMRIEVLTESIRRGELWTRMGSVWLAGHGYASSFFYGDTFLMIPALLRMLGFSLDSAYRLFVAAVNLATAGIAYACFRKCFHSRYIGMFGCVLYTLQPYRIYNLYNRAAVGEYTAMIFLPLLALGFYKIYTEEPKGRGYLSNCLIPVAGFSGIIQSHALSCEMMGMLVVFLCLILWKKTFRPRTFQVLALTVVMTIAVNAWFLVPFLDLMAADSYYFGRNMGNMIQSRGILPAHLFYTLQAGGASSRFAENGMMDTEPINIGLALLLCVLLWLVVRFGDGGAMPGKEWARERKTADIPLVLGCSVLFMSTCYFPWDRLSALSPVFAALNGSLQFPTRLMSLAGICMVMVGCIAAGWVLKAKTWGSRNGIILGGIAMVAILFGSYQVNDILLTRDGFFRIYSPQGMGRYSTVLGAEYLPEGAEMEHMAYHGPVLSEGIAMDGYEKNGLTARGYADTETGGYIEFPLLYYKGYEAYAMDTGEPLLVEKGDHADVRVLFPEGFSGRFQVRYAGMWYWHVAEAVSMATVLGLCIWYGSKRWRKAKR